MKEQETTITLLLEIDPEKKVFYITDYTDPSKGCAKKFRNKIDIVKIFKRFLINNVNLYSYKNNRCGKHDRK